MNNKDDMSNITNDEFVELMQPYSTELCALTGVHSAQRKQEGALVLLLKVENLATRKSDCCPLYLDEQQSRKLYRHLENAIQELFDGKRQT